MVNNKSKQSETCAEFKVAYQALETDS